MAAIMLLAIILWFMDVPAAHVLTGLGILLAMVIPFVAIATAMVFLFRRHETNYALCATILLVIIFVTVVWRMMQ